MKHLVRDYTGLNFIEIGALDYLTYLSYRRDAYIYTLGLTEEGREYLANARRMERTKPDRVALRAQLGKE